MAVHPTPPDRQHDEPLTQEDRLSSSAAGIPERVDPEPAAEVDLSAQLDDLLLPSADLDTTREAMATLVEARDLRAVPRFQAILKDPDSPLLMPLLGVLPGWAHPDFLAPLGHILNQPRFPWKAEVLECLAHYRTPQAAHLAREHLSSEDPLLRRLALQAIACCPTPAFYQAALERLEDPVQEVQIQAASTLAAFGGRRAAKDLAAILPGAGEELALAVADLLREHGSASEAQRLSVMLDPDESFRSCLALDLMVELGCLPKVSELLPLAEAGDPDLRLEAARCAVRLPAPSALKVLEKTCKDTHRKVRLEAVALLDGLRDDGAVKLLLALLEDPHPPVRVAALQTLGRSHREGVTSEAMRLLSDTATEVRRTALEVLQANQAILPPERLTALLSDGDTVLRDTARQMLTQAAPSSSRVEEALAMAEKGELNAAIASLGGLLVREPGHTEASFHLGRLLLAQGDREGARQRFLDLFEDHPRHGGTLRELTGLALEDGDLIAAREYLTLYLKLAPYDSWAQRNLASVELDTGRHAEAAARLSSYLEVHYDDPQAHLMLARAFLSMDRPEDAADQLDRARELGGTEDSTFRIVSARLAMARGALDEACVELEHAHRLDPKDRSLSLWRAEVLCEAGRFEEAVHVLESMGEPPPHDATRHLYIQARALHGAGEPTRALSSLETLLHLCPGHVEALLLRARIHEEQGEPRKALDALLSARSIDPSAEGLLLSLARVYRTIGENDQALRVYESYVQEHLTDLEGLKQLAGLARELGQETRALSTYSVCLTLDPNDREALLAAGEIHHANGQIDQALELTRRALDRSEEPASILVRLGRLNLEKGDRRAARRYYARAVECGESGSSVRWALVGLLLEEEDLEAATSHGRELDPDMCDPEFCRDLGAAYLERNDPGEGRRWLQSAHSRTPEDRGVLENLCRLEWEDGHHPEALGHARALLGIDNAHPLATRVAGLILTRAGEHHPGMNLLQLALQADPEDREVREALADSYVALAWHADLLDLYQDGRTPQGPGRHGRLLDMARAHLALDQGEGAREVLRTLVNEETPSPEPYRLLARLALEEEDTDEVERTLAAGLAQVPDDAELLLLRGVNLRDRGLHGAARSLLHRALAAAREEAGEGGSPTLTRALEELASLESELDRPEHALPYLSELIALGTGGKAAILPLLQRAEILAMLGRNAEARDDLLRVLRIDPARNRARLELARLNLRMDRAREAVESFEEYLDGASSRQEGLQDLADIYLREGKHEDAEKILAELVELGAPPRRSTLPMVELLFTTSREDEAWALVEDLAGPHPELLPELAARLRDRALWTVAGSLFLRAYEDHGRDVEHLFQHAVCLRESGKIEEAERRLRELLSRRPGHPEGNVLLASIMADDGRREEAGRHSDRTLAHDPCHVPALTLQARLALECGQLDEAEQILERVVSSGGETASVLSLRGALHRERHEFEEALQADLSSLSLDPAQGETACRTAKALEERGQAERARDILEEALRRKPGEAAVRAQLVQLLHRAGDHRGVLRQLDELGKVRGLQEHELALMARAALEEGELARAQRANRRCLERNSGNLDALLLAGDIEKARGDLPGAAERYRDALIRHPGAAECSFKLAELLQRLGRFEEALVHASRTVEIEPRHPRANALLGRLLLQLGRPDEALRTFERALNGASGGADIELVVETSAAYLRQGDIDSSLRVLRTTRPEDRKDPDFIAQLARIHLAREDWKRAREAYERLAAMRDLNEEETRNHVKVTAGTGELTAAMALYRKAEENGQASDDLALDLAAAWARQGRDTEALEVLTGRVQAVRPRAAPRVRLEIARLLLARRDLKGAERTLLAALHGDPENREVAAEVAALYLRSGRHDRLERVFRHVTGRAPGNVAAHCHLASAHLHQGKFREALESYRRAVRLDYGSVEAHTGLARTHRHGGDLSSAVEEYRKALHLAPGNPRLLFELATTYRARGDESQAQQTFRKLLEVEPKSSRLAAVARELTAPAIAGAPGGAPGSPPAATRR